MAAHLEREKEAAARAAARRVQRGMRVALGTGSTASHAVRAIAQAFPHEGQIETVASSVATEELARRLGLRVRPLSAGDRFDVMIDGADEVSPTFALTKGGGGGALLREKLLAHLSKERLIVVDHTKLVQHLGERMPIPVEVVPYARPIVVHTLEEKQMKVAVRMGPDGRAPFHTDNGNEILDVRPHRPIDTPPLFDAELQSIIGVIETGIFLGLAERVFVGRADGRVDELLPP